MNGLGYFNREQDASLVSEGFTRKPQRDHRISCDIEQTSGRTVVLKNRQSLELRSLGVSTEATVCCPSEKLRLDLSEARLVRGSALVMLDAVE